MILLKDFAIFQSLEKNGKGRLSLLWIEAAEVTQDRDARRRCVEALGPRRIGQGEENVMQKINKMEMKCNWNSKFLLIHKNVCID